jgi:ABC-type transport system involved in Fe-S cluster assembly fused permease/ATPase subunit
MMHICAVCAAVLQAAFCRISCAVFGHLLALDLNFHVHRKTGQIMRILDRGTSSIQVRQTAAALVPQRVKTGGLVFCCSDSATAVESSLQQASSAS